jgi:hypothetical protein
VADGPGTDQASVGAPFVRPLAYLGSPASIMNRDRHRVALRLLIARRRRVLRDCTVGCKKNGICQNKIDTFLPTIFSWCETFLG